MQLATPQKRLGPRSFLVCLLAVSVLSILMFDMYVPALPDLQREFSVSAEHLNLTVFLFLAVSAVAVLVTGPAADRFGRKTSLLAAGAIYAVSSAACALAPTVDVLVVARVFQAIPNGMFMTLGSMLVKDSYAGDDLKFAMSVMQSLVIVGPVLAPFLGTFALVLAGWRAIFWFLALCGVACFAVSLLMSETLPPAARMEGSVGSSLREMATRSRTLITKRSFTPYAMVVGLAGLPYMGCLAVISYIVIDDFAAGYTVYNVVYAALCVISIVAPFIYLKIPSKVHPRTITVVCLVLAAVSTVLTAVMGNVNPWLFLLALSPFILMEGVIRPMGFVLLMDQKDEYVATASALLNFLYSVMGALGSVFATLPWSSYVTGLAVIMGACTVLMAVCAWLFFGGAKRRAAS